MCDGPALSYHDRDSAFPVPTISSALLLLLLLLIDGPQRRP
jgi:hypothetical protein